MDVQFWKNKWKINQIGFHKPHANPLLTNHLDKLALRKGARVFLPLCGKTLDIAYLLDQGFKVVGIEFSALAIAALFEQLKLTPTISQVGNLDLYQAENIDIYVGDFFDINSQTLGKVDAVYDRASLIALPLNTRQQYTKHLADISQQVAQLLVLIEYDTHLMEGPPFSVTAAELKQHYAESYTLERVENNDTENGLKGQFPVTESVWVLQPN